MRLPWTADRAPDEWREVPIYTNARRIIAPIVRRAFDVEVIGREHVPPTGGVILASNHASFLDPFVVGCTLDRPIRYMAKSDLFRHPLTDAFFTSAGQVKVDRAAGGNEAAVDALVRVVEQGRVAGIYPEGSRSPDGRLGRGRTGVARVALRTGAPVVPLAVTSDDVMPKHARFPHVEKQVVVVIGEPLRYEGMAELAHDRATCRKVTDEVMSEIARLLEVARTHRARLAYERGEDA